MEELFLVDLEMAASESVNVIRHYGGELAAQEIRTEAVEQFKKFLTKNPSLTREEKIKWALEFILFSCTKWEERKKEILEARFYQSYAPAFLNDGCRKDGKTVEQVTAEMEAQIAREDAVRKIERNKIRKELNMTEAEYMDHIFKNLGTQGDGA